MANSHSPCSLTLSGVKSISRLSKFFLPCSYRSTPEPPPVAHDQTQPCELISRVRSSRSRRIASSISKALPSSLRRHRIDSSPMITQIRQLTQQSKAEPVARNEVLATSGSQEQNASSDARHRTGLPRSLSSLSSETLQTRPVALAANKTNEKLPHGDDPHPPMPGGAPTYLSTMGCALLVTSRSFLSIKERPLQKSAIRKRSNSMFLSGCNILVERPYQHIYNQEGLPISAH